MSALKSFESWLEIPTGSHFSLANIPFGIISSSETSSRSPHPAIAIGDYALDLAAFASQQGFSSLPFIEPHLSVFSQPTLNAFAALGRRAHTQVRQYLQSVFAINTSLAHVLRDNAKLRQQALIPLENVQNHLPLHIGGYTDFFAGINHAFTAGTINRGPENALNPNYRHLPAAYHSRASSIVVSGTPIRRPSGQIIADPTAKPPQPIFSPSKRLDIELELGIFICRENTLGDPVPVGSADEAIFGAVLLNDWSARDIQLWEYVPLGPFNAKNFATTISPWVVLSDALEPFFTESLERDRPVLPYLVEGRSKNVWDIQLQVDLTPQNAKTTTLTRTSSKNIIWSVPQMVAHHTITGCNLQVGDFFGSGTISGTEEGTYGCLFEHSKGGKVAIKLEGGQERTFLDDGDTVTITGWAGDNPDALVGFGKCIGQIQASIK
ncbi:fumarylacetoacetase [Leptodontidium sp. MPI-SDFR-AT-0119]|nr:fumarylacetoacetase [Leptodontidium sp. MPI-SDFR-AT-0119]